MTPKPKWVSEIGPDGYICVVKGQLRIKGHLGSKGCRSTDARQLFETTSKRKQKLPGFRDEDIHFRRIKPFPVKALQEHLKLNNCNILLYPVFNRVWCYELKALLRVQTTK